MLHTCVNSRDVSERLSPQVWSRILDFVTTPEELMLQDLHDHNVDIEVDPKFVRLYNDLGANGRMFANFHERLNGHFDFMNRKARTNHHFNAEDGRQLIALIQEIRDAQQVLERSGMEFVVADSYRKVLEVCETFLVDSGGSPIPEDLGDSSGSRGSLAALDVT